MDDNDLNKWNRPSYSNPTTAISAVLWPDRPLSKPKGKSGRKSTPLRAKKQHRR
jgi:hypothetical protein